MGRFRYSVRVVRERDSFAAGWSCEWIRRSSSGGSVMRVDSFLGLEEGVVVGVVVSGSLQASLDSAMFVAGLELWCG